MSKKMLVNATLAEENRVAIVVDGILAGLDIEVSGREPTKGNIYKAAVVRVETGLQAAFVDYGAERLGFLQIDEVNATTVKPDYSQDENGKGRPRINDLLHRGQEILVQITKEERGTKGAALTTYLSLAGRYMVCMPGSKTRGVSRKVETDKERKELKQAMDSLNLPEGIGYIVRTAGLGKTKEELQRDFTYLKHLYDEISDKGNSVKAPALVYKESNLVIRSIRDSFTTDMDEVLIDDPEVFKEAKEFFKRIMPEYANLVKLHQERRPIFSRYQIEDQIETINQNKVPLPSGGSIVIDPTEALVAIDVNSGKMTSEQGVEATAFKANLEAADEIGRQLRLRDLGGLIVIDFIDMRESKHNRKVEAQLKKSVELDKARISIGRISKFGLLEMSRQRLKAALAEGSSLACPHCHGSGRVKSAESLAVGLIRRIHAGVAKGQVGRVNANLPLEVASYLLNNKREDLFELERRYNLQIHIHGQPDYLTDQVEIDFQKREKEKQIQADYVDAGSVPLPPEPETEQTADTQEENGEATEKPKRKRRRRRRKPASGAQAATDTATTAEEAEQKPDQGEPQPAEPVAAEMGSTPAVNEEKPIRQHPAQEKETPTKEAEATATPEAQAETPTEITSTEDGGTQAKAAPEQTAKPKRRRSPRKKTAEKPSVTEGSIENSPKAEVEPATEQEKQKPKPRRRSPRRKAAEPPTEQATETSAPAVEATESGAVTIPEVTTEETPKRKRTPRKKPAGESVEKTTTSQADLTGAVNATEATEEKPKPRRRAPRKKAAPETAATQDAPQQAETPDAKPVEEKPKPRRHAPRKKTAPETAAPQDTPQQAETPDAKPVEEKPKPRRRAPRKKTAPDTAAAQDAPQQAEAPDAKPVEEKPKPRRRAPRKKAAPDTAAAQDAPQQAEAPDAKPAEEKPKPRRRTTRKKPVETTDAPETSN